MNNGMIKLRYSTAFHMVDHIASQPYYMFDDFDFDFSSLTYSSRLTTNMQVNPLPVFKFYLCFYNGVKVHYYNLGVTDKERELIKWGVIN